MRMRESPSDLWLNDIYENMDCFFCLHAYYNISVAHKAQCIAQYGAAIPSSAQHIYTPSKKTITNVINANKKRLWSAQLRAFGWFTRLYFTALFLGDIFRRLLGCLCHTYSIVAFKEFC